MRIRGENTIKKRLNEINRSAFCVDKFFIHNHLQTGGTQCIIFVYTVREDGCARWGSGVIACEAIALPFYLSSN